MTRKILAYLDGQFGSRMLAMDSIQGHVWPARSPDLNPLDFFCWGFRKHKVFTPKQHTMQELKERIIQEVANLDKSMIKRACADVTKRCTKVLAANGGYIE